jgi:hypothetical protein
MDRRLTALGAFIGSHSVLLSLALLAGGVALAATAVTQKSVTVDEYSVLPHGLAILKTGDFHLDPGIPPLASELSAAPLLLTSAQMDINEYRDAVTTWQLGQQFMRANANDYHRLFMYGRIAPLMFLLLTGILIWGFSRSLYGSGAALLSAAVVAALPNLLAHGALITPDIFVTAGFIGALWAFDALQCRPGWRAALALGIFVGVATLAKFTGLLLCVILPLVLLGLQMSEGAAATPESGRRKTWRGMASAAVVTLFIINAGYGFAGAFTPISEYRFDTPVFQSIQGFLPGPLPVPLPYRFVQSMDTQWAEEGYSAYLLGEFNETGFLHYYLVGLLVKTPTPVLLLALLALLSDRRIRRREVPMLVVAGLIFCFFSLSRHKNIGIRYVLFVEPILAIWIGRLAAKWSVPWQRSWLAWLTLASVTWLWVGSLVAWPNYLPYFNELSGGPSKGHRYLLDSNLDWGQDLMTLREYMRNEGIESVDLAYFGRVDPRVYGIPFKDYFGEGPPQQRYVAISANLLWGRNYFVNGTSEWSGRDAYAPFRRWQPKAVLGHTIYIFDMERLRPALP